MEKFTIDDYKKILEYGRSRDTDKIKSLIHEKMNIIQEGDKYNLSNIKKFNKDYSPDTIDINMYDSYYVCSDLHADLMSFFATFLKSGIIKIKDVDTNEFIHNLSQPEYGNINILEDCLSKYEIELSVPAKTCILILGDLVDGARMISWGQIVNVYNPNGLNEILIHMILYNMRLDALSKQSYVKVLIGNHDLDAIMHNKLVGQYVDNATAELYGGTVDKKFSNRKEILFPFYSIDASLYEIIYKDNTSKKEICALLSHGSFSEEKELFNNIIPVIFDKKIEIKNYIFSLLEEKKVIKINKDGNFDRILNIQDKSIDSLIFSILWSRHIPDVYNNYDACVDHSYISNNTTLIMGHCPTTLYGKYRDGWKGYETCDSSRPCVNINCVKNKIPKIILVDNALSNALSGITEKRLPNFTELLLIKHKNQELNYYTLRLPFHLPISEIIIYKTDITTDNIRPSRNPISMEDQTTVLTGGKIKKYIYKINNVSEKSSKYNLYCNKLNYYTYKNKKYLNFIN